MGWGQSDRGSAAQPDHIHGSCHVRSRQCVLRASCKTMCGSKKARDMVLLGLGPAGAFKCAMEMSPTTQPKLRCSSAHV